LLKFVAKLCFGPRQITKLIVHIFSNESNSKRMRCCMLSVSPSLSLGLWFCFYFCLAIKSWYQTFFCPRLAAAPICSCPLWRRVKVEPTNWLLN